MLTVRRLGVVAVVLGLVATAAWAWVQSPQLHASLDEEVARIGALPFQRDPDRPVVVVTGSSTIRLWEDAAAAYPGAQVVNTGFGGSTMADLAEHHRVLIHRYGPDVVIIHEGDNDLALGRTPEQILGHTRSVVGQIHERLPATRIVLVSAKPSPQRWARAPQYRELNDGYRRMAAADARVAYADVWPALLGSDGTPDVRLYEPDGLHLNAAGYDRWTAVLMQSQFQPAV